MVSSSSSCFSFLFRFCREKVGTNAFTLWGEAKEQLELGRKDWGVCSQKVNEWMAGLLSISGNELILECCWNVAVTSGHWQLPRSPEFWLWVFQRMKFLCPWRQLWNSRKVINLESKAWVWILWTLFSVTLGKSRHHRFFFFNCKNLINGYLLGLGGLTIICTWKVEHKRTYQIIKVEKLYSISHWIH